MLILHRPFTISSNMGTENTGTGTCFKGGRLFLVKQVPVPVFVSAIAWHWSNFNIGLMQSF